MSLNRTLYTRLNFMWIISQLIKERESKPESGGSGEGALTLISQEVTKDIINGVWNRKRATVTSGGKKGPLGPPSLRPHPGYPTWILLDTEPNKKDFSLSPICCLFLNYSEGQQGGIGSSVGKHKLPLGLQGKQQDSHQGTSCSQGRGPGFSPWSGN